MNDSKLNREEMIAFLRGHYRYYTMNSWNGSSSYACNIKISHLDLTRAQQEPCYRLLEVEGCHAESGFSYVLEDFASRHNHAWQIGQNGRSGGYLVLYQGERKLSSYRSECTRCLQRNCQEATETDKRCGRCGAEARVNRVLYETRTYPGLGTDQNEDFSDWDDEDLESRVALVKDFDRTCAEAVKVFVAYAMENEVVEETVMVPKTFKRTVPRGEGHSDLDVQEES